MAHPPFPALPASGKSPRHIFAFCALKNDAARSRLIPMLDAEWKRKGSTPKSQTISAAINALDLAGNEDLRDARRHGELLFAWHGTKAFEVPA